MIVYGSTRAVLLIGKLAIKVPIFWKGVKIFVKGWIGNIDERDLYRKLAGEHVQTKLAPVKFSMLGLINIMTKASPYKFDPKNTDEFNAKILLFYFSDVPIEIDICSRGANLGYINHKLVLVDYATCRESSAECDNCYCKSIDK